MKYSGVGGQAVMEGVMMRNQDQYAVAVRKPDDEIEVKISEYQGLIKNKTIKKLPIIRGVMSFIDSLYLGTSTLMYSASFYEDEEEECKKKGLSKDELDAYNLKKNKEDKKLMGATLCFSIVFSILLFFVLPYVFSIFFEKMIGSKTIITLIECLIRLMIFVGYIAIISLTPDIKRVFMYHGAEHKCINCIEHGLELNVDNVRKSSKHHKRCGTSFLLIVMIISMVFFMFIQFKSHIARLVLRLVCIPIIAGVSYEFIRLAGKGDNLLVNILSAPGLWLQRLTTKEPDDDMIEVGIASVEAVFDWKEWQKEQNV
ncbi:Uncharacterized conserved protein YqhQ [Lachnospiraceae bacterium C7]|nr:Uncharacterized conserved protein YqhQ [Lachnospiraceae bacterium C7]